MFAASAGERGAFLLGKGAADVVRGPIPRRCQVTVTVRVTVLVRPQLSVAISVMV